MARFLTSSRLYKAGLCVLPFLMAMSVNTLAQVKPTELTRRVDTIKKMDEIETALHLYSTAHDRLPCPARSDRVPTATDFGQEASTSDDCGNAHDPSIDNVFIGVLPVRELHLDDSYMLDGWGRRFAYVVDQRFANRGVKATDLNGNESSYLSTIKSEIDVRDSVTGNSLYDNVGDEVIAVLMSYGSNGHGAYTLAGNRIDTGTTDVDELANSHYDGGGAFDAIFVQKEPTATFDDIVRVIRRNNDVALTCPGYGSTINTGGSTPDIQAGYPAYDWTGVAIGATETKECRSGYEGEVQRQCTSTSTEAIWNTTPPDPQSTCQCPEIAGDSGDGYGNVNWPATTPSASPGTEVTSSCGSPTPDSLYDGFYSGTVSRYCVGDGTVWSAPVSGCTCNQQTLSGMGYTGVTFPAGIAVGETDSETCDGGYTGSVTATCEASGGWVVTGNNCTLSTF